MDQNAPKSLIPSQKKLLTLVDKLKQAGVQQFSVSTDGSVSVVFHPSAIQQVINDNKKDPLPKSLDDLVREQQKQPKRILGHDPSKLFYSAR